MDIFDEEIIKFWKSLQDNNVRDFIEGGFVTRNWYQRYTGDMDIWIDNSQMNRANGRT